MKNNEAPTEFGGGNALLASEHLWAHWNSRCMAAHFRAEGMKHGLTPKKSPKWSRNLCGSLPERPLAGEFPTWQVGFRKAFPFDVSQDASL